VLYNTLEALRLAATYCQPFIPATARALAGQLGLDLDAHGDWPAATRWGGFPAGTTLHPGGVLFPKREVPEP
jgi:methionyl-tRNA synthetase